MAVRFLPPPEDRPKPQREEQGDLAEVIEFRSRLRRPEPAPAEAAELLPENDRSEHPNSAGGGADRPAGEHQWANLIDVPFGRARAAGSEALGAPAAARGAAGRDAALRDETPLEPAAIDSDSNSNSDSDNDDEAELDDGPTAYETSVKLLARRALSSGELQRALVAAGHPELDAEEAVAKCVDSLYLDDADLACSVATKLRESKGESKARIRQKLRERHLPDAAIEAALEGLDDDAEHELLRQTAVDRACRMTGLDRQTAERRLLGFLARRGWSGERASRAAREALDGAARGAGGSRGSVRFQ